MSERKLVTLLKELLSLIGTCLFYKHFTATRFFRPTPKYVVAEKNLGGGKPPRCFRQTTLHVRCCVPWVALCAMARMGRGGSNSPRYRGSGHAVCWPCLPSPLGKQGRILLE
jgi:hypothetical protein